MKKILILLLIILPFTIFGENISSIKTETASGQDLELHAVINIPEGYHLTYSEDYLTVKLIDPPAGVSLGKIEYPEGITEIYFNEITGENVNTIYYYGTITLKAAIRIPDTGADFNELQAAVTYQMCDDNACYPPVDEVHTFSVSITEKVNSVLQILKYLLLAFIGGLALNLTPCIWPVLTIKAINMVQQSNLDRKKIFINSWLYILGVMISVFVIALITVILKQFMGITIIYGAQFQHPVFNIIMMSILIIFSMALFDVFLIRLPGMNKAASVSGKTGYKGSFFTGLFAFLLGSACAAPLMGIAIGFSFSLPSIWIIPFYLLIGIGLALPFILLSFWPALVQKLPKPGKWMEVFKKIMGFILIGFSLPYIKTLQTNNYKIDTVLLFVLIIAVGFYIYGKLNQPKYKKSIQFIGIAALLIFIASAIIFFPPVKNKNIENGIDIAAGSVIDKNSLWQNFTPDLLEEYRASGKPVFIDFTADWCKICQVNKDTVLRTTEIETAFKEYGVELLTADMTISNQGMTDLILSYGRAAVPVYVFYSPFASKPLILPDSLSKSVIIEMLETHLEKSSVPGNSMISVPGGVPGDAPLPVPKTVGN